MKFYTILIILTTIAITDCFAQKLIENHSKSYINSSDTNQLNQIKICQWNEGSNTCVSLTFDDNQKTHKQISFILDKYGFKGTFFAISSYMRIVDLKDILSRGHEIGNHSNTHPYFPNLDSLAIENEVIQGKDAIEKTFGIKCVSFATPGHGTNPLVKRIILSHKLFIRNESEYSEINRDRAYFIPSTTIKSICSSLNNAIKNKTMLLIVGHGIDGDGNDVVTTDFLKQSLDTIQKYAKRNDVWVATLKDGAQYENLFHELNLEKKLVGDTVKIKINNYLKEKYQSLNSSPISIEIPTECFGQVRYLYDSIEIKHLPTKDIVTIDLKKSTQLSFLIGANNLLISTDPVTISGSTTVCQGQESVIYTVPLIANATSYVWTLPLAATGTCTTNSITMNYGTAAGSSNITVKGTNSCMDGPISTIFITVNEKPAPPSISLKGNILHSDATIANQWYNQSGLINEAWGQDFIVNSANNYYNIVSLQGCKSDPSKSIRILQTDIDLANTSIPVTVYPNPFSNELHIETDGNTENTNFEISNYIGRIILRSSLLKNTVIQTTRFTPGIYLLKIKTGKTLEIKKLIKN